MSDSPTLGQLLLPAGWNRGADTASPAQVPFTAGTPLTLTGTGLTVTLTGTSFRPGGFWIIAARPDSPARVVPRGPHRVRLPGDVRSAITVGDVRVWIAAEPRVIAAWDTVADWRRLPARRRGHRAVGEFLYDLAEDIARGLGTVGVHDVLMDGVRVPVDAK